MRATDHACVSEAARSYSGAMKLDSKYFDMIRINRRGAESRNAKHDVPCCQWKGCTEPGRYRAPLGRGRDGEFFTFCVEHVRQYNNSYNYFDGMSDSEVERFQKAAVYGHRPTWKTGANAWAHGTPRGASAADMSNFAQARAAEARGFHAWRARQSEGQERRRILKPLERKALETLDLPENSSKDEI